jgi:hypothetical protein
MEELSEIPGKTRGAGVSALVGHLFNAQMEIGEKKLSFFRRTSRRQELKVSPVSCRKRC